MKKELPAYEKIDMEHWPRREHFTYYRNSLKCGYSLTAKIDVTKILQFARSHKKRFFGCFLYAVSKTVNMMDSMRMMVPPEGGAGVWKVSHPNFTVFHEDDETFSDLWTEYRSDFSEFYQGFEEVLMRYGNQHGIKGRPEQPANFFCVSCVPWLDYTGYATSTVDAPALFPIIVFVKYTEQGGCYTLPVTVTISHASADGYHTSLFFKKLQENLELFDECVE